MRRASRNRAPEKEGWCSPTNVEGTLLRGPTKKVSPGVKSRQDP